MQFQKFSGGFNFASQQSQAFSQVLFSKLAKIPENAKFNLAKINLIKVIKNGSSVGEAAILPKISKCNILGTTMG